MKLRFYVRHRAGDELRRGVVFIREIILKRAVAWIARMAYNENYIALPMRHSVSNSGGSHVSLAYEWRTSGDWSKICAESGGTAQAAAEGSVEQFISEHYWGYTAQRDGGCVEYRVAHPSWRVWQSAKAMFEGDGVPLYGEALGAVLRRAPDSAFIADGSAVELFTGARVA